MLKSPDKIIIKYHKTDFLVHSKFFFYFVKQACTLTNYNVDKIKKLIN